MTVAHADALNAQVAPSAIAIIYKKSAGFRLMQKGDLTGTEADSWFANDTSMFSVAGGFTTSYASNQNDWQVDFGAWDGSSLKHFRNGAKLVPTSVTEGTLVNDEVVPSATPVSNTDALYIGRRLNTEGTSGIVTAQIAEILVLNATITTNTRQKLEGYLAHKWGLTANLPSDHPYKTVGPTP
jgi:hypothetical protein